LWACSVCWIIFACHHLKTGGLIRSFLSHRFWQPLSKLSLSIYLIHYVYIGYVEMKELQPEKGFEFPWIVLISAGDITMSIFFAFFFHLLVEAPIANLINFFISSRKNVEPELHAAQPLKLNF
jgi:peptidoglycan/LPS O-acetylase OafA/YrhL